MELASKPPVHLSYCLNVHPGETWEENLSAIKNHTLAVKGLACPARPFGLGLRLSARAAEELSRPEALTSFRDFLARNRLYVFTVNAFPQGAFHGQRVKENVYAPDWRSGERLSYTKKVCEILSALDLPGGFASVSSVPGSYAPWIKSREDEAAMAENLARAACFLARLGEKTGRRIALALEPEPDCYLESAEGLCAFFRDHLLPLGAPLLAKDLGCGEDRGRELLLRHIGACLDTCHMAVCGEDMKAGIKALSVSGIGLYKLQVSAAPVFSGKIQPERLLALSEPVYLHQARMSCPEGELRFADIDRAAEKLAREPATSAELRVHCHVPLYFSGDESLRSSAADLGPGLFRLAREAGCRHFEVETYTFTHLAPEFRPKPLVQSIACELALARELILGPPGP